MFVGNSILLLSLILSSFLRRSSAEAGGRDRCGCGQEKGAAFAMKADAVVPDQPSKQPRPEVEPIRDASPPPKTHQEVGAEGRATAPRYQQLDYRNDHSGHSSCSFCPGLTGVAAEVDRSNVPSFSCLGDSRASCCFDYTQNGRSSRHFAGWKACRPGTTCLACPGGGGREIIPATSKMNGDHFGRGTNGLE